VNALIQSVPGQYEVRCTHYAYLMANIFQSRISFGVELRHREMQIGGDGDFQFLLQ